MDSFTAFPSAGLRFLTALAKNNQREWFQARKPQYDEHVHQPMLAMADLLNRELIRIAPAYAFPNSAKALNRIYRDVRFSANKTPYQDHMSLLFPQQKLGKKQGAAFFISISPKETMVAGGMYFGDTRQLQAVREHLAQHHAAFRKLLASKPRAALFGGLEGEQLQRVPRQFGTDHVAADLLRHKQWMLWTRGKPEDATKPGFGKDLIKAIQLLVPFVDFLNEPLLALPAVAEME